ncbi:MAG: M16 family metallopeptidase [Bacteriovoracia bacterium]
MNNKILSFAGLGGVLFALFIFGCATTGGSGGPVAGMETQPFIGKFQVYRKTFPNGLKLLVVEDHTSPTFAYQTWFRVGSRNEVPQYTGLAHLFEHMMFKATKTRPEGTFDRTLEEAGAEGENAFTSHDYTAYIQELPKNKLAMIAELESDRMTNLIVNEQAFKTETEVVQNERRFRTENNPDGLMYQTLFETAYQKHPYKWPVIGYQADLNRMAAADAVAFYQKHYSPATATIVVVGDVDPAEVSRTVEKHYGHLPKHALPEMNLEVEPAQTTIRRKNLPLDVQVEKLYMAYHVPPANSPDSAAFEVLQGILTEGKGSRLALKLVDTSVASGVESGSYQGADPTLFVFHVNLQEKRRAAEAEAIINSTLADLMKKPVPAAELERAKNLMNFTFYQNLTSNSAKANFLGRYETVMGDFRGGLKIQEQIAAVTSEDVQRVVKTYFKPAVRTIIRGMPKGGQRP